MTLRPALRIAAVAALAVLGLIGLVVWESWQRAAGTEVVLSIATVDPRGLLSGDYVAISLQEPVAVGRACPPGIDTDPAAVTGKEPEQWIALAPAGDHAAAVGAAGERAGALRFAPLVVRGRATCAAPTPATADSGGAPGTLALDLGVDRFYADQAEVQRINETSTICQSGSCPVAAIVSIGRDGKARLKGLRINGQRVVLSSF